MKQYINILLKKREKIALEEHQDPKVFIKYSNNMEDFFNNIEQYNPDRKRKLIVFDDMTADTIINQKFNQIVTEIFVRGKKLNISTVLSDVNLTVHIFVL